MKSFNWDAKKNQQLIDQRGKSFEEIIFHIQNGDLLDDIAHPNVVDKKKRKRKGHPLFICQANS
ncbi:hypothetical protein J7438_10930 [Thalassotalea sp. G20_0]|uniref:hypothetical protein n=1 Tax=Thalassotalea sp. G20_0 TaxID=2821093 RepID=UPI001ADD47B8|nr:hypothetical protein [Thalassotalea sp. G20_0]MBO9494600.1 hypothetical protein [Thalassotalea sp. G20_0]